MHATPLIDHTINTARTNISWDKHKTPISILKPSDKITDINYKKWGNISLRATTDPESGGPARTQTHLAQS